MSSPFERLEKSILGRIIKKGIKKILNDVSTEAPLSTEQQESAHKTFSIIISSIIIMSKILILGGMIAILVPRVFAAPLSTSKLPPPKGIIIHKRTPYFIDIEAPVDQVWVGCNEGGPTLNSTSGMMFYVLDGHTAYEFYYRSVDSVRMCLKKEREYRQLMQGTNSIRFVGIHSLEEPSEPEPSPYERIPKRFTSATKTISQVFIRMQAGNHCKAYFSEHCKLPENYWGGTIPESKISETTRAP